MPRLFSNAGDLRRATILVLLVLPPIVFVLVAPLLVPDTNDDAYIFLRVARNVLLGHGPVYNPGERVEVYSSPLWLALLALAGALSSAVREPFRFVGVAQGLSTVCVVGMYFLLFLEARRLTGRIGWALGAAWCLLLFPASLVWARSGMDGPLAALLLLLLLRFTFDPETGPRGRCWLSSLLVWARPEGALWVLALRAISFRAQPVRENAKEFAWPLLSLAGLLLWRRFWFGEWLPNTYFAKRGGGAIHYRGGLLYALDFCREHFAAILIAAAIAALLRSKSRTCAPSVAALLAFWLILVGLVVVEGGDFLWYHRLLYPALAPLLLLGACALGALFSGSGQMLRFSSVAVAVAYLFCAGKAALSGELVERAQEVHKKHLGESRAARVLASALLPAETLAIGPAGKVVYESSPFAAYDFYGLVELDVARAPAIAGRPGHRRFSAPLLLARRPDFVFFSSVLSRFPPCALLDADAFPGSGGNPPVPKPTELFVQYARSHGYELVVVQESSRAGKGRYLPLAMAPQAMAKRRTAKVALLEALCPD